MLVAHEPPLFELLPNRAELRAGMEDASETHLREGAGPAMGKFMALAGLAGEARPREPDPGRQAAMARMLPNIDLFFRHMNRFIVGYRPDAEALRAAATRIAVGAGTASHGQVAHRAAVALAGLLGREVVDFPGGHGGFVSDPEAFAQTLLRVLA